MNDRDPFPRRTANVARLLPWLAEIASTIPGLVDSYTRKDVLNPRTRERIILAVTEVNGCRYCAWIHGSWQDFLGDVPSGMAEDALLGYARACAEAGRPLDPSPLADVLPPEAVRAVRATVAQIEVSNLVGNTVDGLLARVTRARPLDPLAAIQEIVAVGAALPLAMPLVGAAAALRMIERLAPRLGAVNKPAGGEANLLVHVLAEAMPLLLANAGVRLLVLNLPMRVPVAVRAGRTTATMRIGRGGITLENGVAGDAIAVVEGEVDTLLKLVTGSLLREIGNVRIRPGFA
jgi:alkylhydroperoxidase family enzyme